MGAEVVLVIDDDAASRDACCDAVNSAGYRSVAAASGLAALARLGVEPALRGSLGLAIVDYHMPELDGLATYRALRRDLPDLAGVLLAGSTSLTVAVEALNLGFGQVLTKPVEHAAVVEATEAALAERRAVLENDRLRTLTRLYAALDELAALTDRAALLEATLRLAAEQTGAQRVSLMTVDDRSRTLRVVAALGLAEEQLARAVCPVGQPVSGWVFSHGVALELARDKPVPAVVAASLHRPEVSASVCLPLAAAGEPLGVLNLSLLGESGGFAPGAIEVATVLADDAALNLRRIDVLEARADQERSATVGRLASTIIHDLRGPVTIIAGATEMLEETNPHAAVALGGIAAEVGLLERTCDQLLSFARDKSSLATELVEAGQLLQAVAAGAGEALRLAAVTVICEAPPGVWLAVARDELTRVLADLVAAAAETMAPGSRLRLTIEEDPPDLFLRLSGESTAAAEWCRQLDAAGGLGAGGVGLALALLRHLAARHQGRLEVQAHGPSFAVALRLPPSSTGLAVTTV